MSEFEPPQGLVLNRALIDTLRADLSALSFTVPAIESLLGPVASAAHLTVAADVTEERYLEPGSADPRVVVLRQGDGLGRGVQADTALAGFVGACDGELTVGQIVGALAGLLDVPAEAVRAELAPQVRDLVRDGFLLV